MVENETETKTPVVHIERTIAAPAEMVYRAWLDPDVLRRWIAPPAKSVTKVEVDEEVGGHWGIWHTSPEGKEGGFEADIVEMVPGRKLVFAWHFIDIENAVGKPLDSLLTLTFDDAPDGGTILSLTHERLEDLNEAMPDLVGRINTGWGEVLDRLPAVVEA
jgi:uncharacterized protein YndB with AHSA1/START domain